MTKLLYFLICIIATTVGAISGVGGGVIIKPVLDATNTLSVSVISFLSGCTVLAMSVVSLIKGRNTGSQLDSRSTWLAVGAAIGGVAGKQLFSFIKAAAGNEAVVGLIQAVVLLVTTLGIVVYMYYKKRGRIVTKDMRSYVFCALMGLFLGVLSSFLGIGGGPINIAVLSYFFSMDNKTAAKSSIYIILLSQITSLVATFVTRSVPAFDYLTLGLMIAGGVSGGFIGSAISKKISDSRVAAVFTSLLVVISLINVYNIVLYASAL